MKKSSEQLQNEFEHIQYKGKQTLRLFVLGILLLLIGYCSTQIYFMMQVFPDFHDQMVTYIWRPVFQILWIFPLWQLWKYRKIGKVLYFLCLVLTLYGCKDIYFYIMDGYVSFQLFHYFIIFFAILWRLILSAGFIKLLHNSKIRSIWSLYDMFDDELADDIEVLKDQAPIKEETPIEKKAKKHLHKYAIQMGSMLYTFIVLAIVLLVIMKMQLPDAKEGIEIIERTLYGNFLFSSFIWMIPIAAMYMYHKSTRWLLVCSMLLEIIKIFLTYTSYIYIFDSVFVDSFAQGVFAIIEGLRLSMLLWWIIKVLRDPYGYHYWKKTQNKNLK